MTQTLEEAVIALRDSFHPENLELLKKVYDEFGTVFAAIPADHELNPHRSVNGDTIMENYNIPYPIHFRLGMAVRNFLRTQEYCREHWLDSPYEYDEFWVPVTEMAIGAREIDEKALYREFRTGTKF